MQHSLKRFLTNESAATAIEYCLIATCIALGIIIGLRLVNQHLSASYNDTNQKISNAVQ